jgi:hypothetical protein
MNDDFSVVTRPLFAKQRENVQHTSPIIAHRGAQAEEAEDVGDFDAGASHGAARFHLDMSLSPDFPFHYALSPTLFATLNVASGCRERFRAPRSRLFPDVKSPGFCHSRSK